MKNKLNSSLSLRKVLLSALVAAPLATLPAPLWALPNTASSNVTSSSGTTTFTTTGTLLTISESSANRLVLRWNEFGSGGSPIAAGDTIVYALPSTGAAVLNTVTTGATTIGGTLQSNGSIYILNPNGITLNNTAVVNAQNFGVSTIPEAEFFFLANGNLAFLGTATQDVTFDPASITVGSGGSVFIAAKNVPSVSGTISAGTLNITAQNGAVNLGANAALTVGAAGSPGYGNLSITTSGGAVNLAAGNTVNLKGSNHTVTTSGGAVTAPSALVLGDGNNASTLTINTGTTAAVTLSDVQNANSGKDAVLAITAGPTSITSTTTNNLKLNASTITGALTVSTAGAITSGGNVTATGTVSLTAGAAKGITYAGVGNITLGTLSTTSGNINITSTSGKVQLPALTTTGSLTVTTPGNITQSGVINAATGTFDASNTNLTTSTNDFDTVVVLNNAKGASVKDADDIILGKGTNATGNVTLTTVAGAIALGAAAGDSIVVNGDLTLTAVGGGITDASDNVTVVGKLNGTADAAIALDGSASNGVGLNSRYGQVNLSTAATGANIRVYELTTLNLGNITTTGQLRAYSKGDVVNNDTDSVISATTLLIGAGTATAPGNITLNAPGNVLGGLTILDDITLFTNAAAPATTGTLLANNLTLASASSVVLPDIVNTLGGGIAGNLSVTVTGAGNDITLGKTVVGGNVTLSAVDAITATNAGNAFSNVSVTAKGVVAVSSSSALTVNASLTGGAASTAAFTAPTLTLDTITSNYTGTLTFTATSNVADAISDKTVAGLAIFGPVQFTSTGGVTIDDAGHNFGQVNIAATAGNNRAVTIKESGTLNLGTVTMGNATFTATSLNGSIIDSGTTTSSGTNVFSASAGLVTLDAGSAMSGRIDISASGNVTVTQPTATVLGNIATGGTLTVNTSAAADKKISQASGTALNVFGAVGLTTNGSDATAGSITVGNTGNRLGGVTAAAGASNITIKEATTLNLRSIATTGGLTATSEGGDIINTGSGMINATGVAGGGSLTGTASFSAPLGNVLLTFANSEYTTVAFPSVAGNVTLTDATGGLTLGTSVIGGTLGVNLSAAGTTLNQTGSVKVQGDVTMITNSGGIVLQDSGNEFGAVRFVTGANGAIIFENTSFNLRGGSNSTGPVQISTNGNFVTSGGASFFSGNVLISAIGTIIPTSDSLFISPTGTLTVFSSSLKDLSALSKSSNLSNKDPVNSGSGPYTPPKD